MNKYLLTDMWLSKQSRIDEFSKWFQYPSPVSLLRTISSHLGHSSSSSSSLENKETGSKNFVPHFSNTHVQSISTKNLSQNDDNVAKRVFVVLGSSLMPVYFNDISFLNVSGISELFKNIQQKILSHSRSFFLQFSFVKISFESAN